MPFGSASAHHSIRLKGRVKPAAVPDWSIAATGGATLAVVGAAAQREVRLRLEREGVAAGGGVDHALRALGHAADACDATVLDGDVRL